MIVLAQFSFCRQPPRAPSSHRLQLHSTRPATVSSTFKKRSTCRRCRASLVSSACLLPNASRAKETDSRENGSLACATRSATSFAANSRCSATASTRSSCARGTQMVERRCGSRRRSSSPSRSQSHILTFFCFRVFTEIAFAIL